MKLRLNGNSLRLRLTRPEVMQLCEAGTVEQSVDFGLGAVLIYRIQSQTCTDPLHAVFCNHSITVRIPADSVALWAGGGRSWALCTARRIEDFSEKDFRCLTRRPDEQEPDAYPHPAE